LLYFVDVDKVAFTTLADARSVKATRDSTGTTGWHETTRASTTKAARRSRSDENAFEFRSLTLRQLKDAVTFFHSGSFTSIEEVVRYFNAGVPQDAVAGAAATLSTT
jgi:cytochrome c peroxidase